MFSALALETREPMPRSSLATLSRRVLQLSGGQQKLAAFALRLGKVLRKLKAQGPAVLVSESDYRHCAAWWTRCS